MSPVTSARAIRHHYDVGNAFYALWLDPTLTYSCALWDGDGDLAEAQVRKLDWHLDRVGAARADRLLDIGCGWGSLMDRATTHYHVGRAVGLTLSANQARWIADRGMDRVEVRSESWTDHIPAETYDAIVSIGAFEHFATSEQTAAEKVDGYRRFFTFCHHALRRGGSLSLQTITYEDADRRTVSPYLAEHVFPESELPHLDEVIRGLSGLFEIDVLCTHRADYARTVRHWLRNLRARRREAEALVGARRVIEYEKYLGLMIVAFHTGALNLARLTLRRRDTSRQGGWQ
jgi:cyclopropane-fatty-acyl-phospholipid synthase